MSRYSGDVTSDREGNIRHLSDIAARLCLVCFGRPVIGLETVPKGLCNANASTVIIDGKPASSNSISLYKAQAVSTAVSYIVQDFS